MPITEDFINGLNALEIRKLAKWLIMTDLHRKHPNMWAKHGRPKKLRKAC